MSDGTDGDDEIHPDFSLKKAWNIVRRIDNGFGGGFAIFQLLQPTKIFSLGDIRRFG